MTKEERLLRQEQRERAKAIEAAAREGGRGPAELPVPVQDPRWGLHWQARFPAAAPGQGPVPR